MQKNELNWLDVTLSMTNTSDKEIVDLRFFAVLKNEQGQQIGGSVNEIFMQPAECFPLAAQKTDTAVITVTQQEAYTIDLYVIYVEFADGSAWGQSGANKDWVKENVPTLPVSVIAPTEDSQI